MEKMADENLQYYIDNQAEIVEKYSGRYIVISSKKIQASFSNLVEAVKYAREKFNSGDFQVQLVEPGRDSYEKIISRTKIYA